jgi:hypothetical protein
LIFKGTVKLHGTNASVCHNAIDGFWIQSRKNKITVAKDNAGFAFFAESNKDSFLDMISSIRRKHNLDPAIYTISIYGEWAGQGIQKSVGISQLDKSFFIFGVKISKLNEVFFNSCWVDSNELRDPDNKIYNVEDYETYSIDIDFNTPQLSQNILSGITERVEGQCPISKAFGIDGIGEGVVWTCEYKDVVHRFKVKGEKHSVTRVKTLANVDVEKLESIGKFVDYSMTKNRFDQAIEEVFGKGELDIKKMGDFLRWVVNDITSEEMDTMNENNLEPKDVNKYLSYRAREMFFRAQKEF